MLKVECEACKAPYQVDERRIPPTGLKMRCPKCGHAFTVANPDAQVNSAPASKHTILGMTAPGMTPAAPAAKPVPPTVDADLPARAAPKPPPVKPPPPKPAARVELPAAPALGDIDELLDLPAVPVDLPAAVKPLPAVKPTLVSSQGGTAPKPAPPPPKVIPSLEDYDDLPAPVADLPAARGAKPIARGPADLPAAKPAKPPPPRGAPPPAPAVGGALTFDVDLPMAVGGGADLPSAKGRSGAFGDLPVPRDAVGLPMPKDSVGLPAPRDAAGLPVPRDVGLPAAFGSVGLPALGGGFGELDFPALGGALPAVAQSLPASVDQQSYLPRATNPGAHLPSAVGGDQHLPSALDALPSALSDSQYLPQNASAPGGAFGEADFGDFGGAPAAAPSGPPVAPQVVPGGQGGVGFGELDFGSSGGDSVAVEAEVAPAPTSVRGGEAALPTDARPKTRDRVVIEEGQGRFAKIVVASGAVVFLLGALLGVTRYGLFGYKGVLDFLHKGQWTADATAGMANARKVLDADVYDQARNASDALATQSAGLPRAQALMAAAALAEYELQLRFGRDASRATRADAWLKTITDLNGTPTSVPFYTPAAAARAASGSDLIAARAAIDAAAGKDSGDPVQEDVAIIRGELELKAKDSPAAIKAFSRALQIAPSAHGHFGLGRAYFLAGDHAKALAEVAATLAATPNHPGALVLKAQVASSDDPGDPLVIEGLKPLLEGPAKVTASAVELSRAYTIFGAAQASRGDMGSARTAYESALKLDSSNGDALLGQGEVFFADGRNTEALSRFDTAVQADPNNPAAIIDDARAKIALERLSDAKTQLVSAHEAMPKNAQITYWMGFAEEKIGNKKGAEDDYVAAIGLTNPKERNAILPYVALSALLASQGRASEAASRLNEARLKLPDSAAMQRALGEVASAQGLFDEAVTHYQTAATRDPRDLRAVFLLGETYLRMRRLDEAKAAFDKVETADRDYPNLAMRRGELLEESGQVEQALAQFRAALERAPKDLDLQLRVGAALVGIGRGDEAYKILKPVYDARQNSAEVNHYLGRARLLQGGTSNLVEAKRYLAKAVDVEGTRAQYHLYLAWVATESQDWKLAELEVEQTLKLDQLNGDAYWQRAIIEEVHGSVDAAIRDALRALELHPGRIEAHATLAKCYGDKNMTEKALAEWALATAHGAEHPEWEFLYGRILYQRGDLGVAQLHVLTAAKAAEAMEPAPVWAALAEFMTAKALLKSGNKIDAKEHFLRFMQSADLSNPDRREAEQTIKTLDPSYHR